MQYSIQQRVFVVKHYYILKFNKDSVKTEFRNKFKRPAPDDVTITRLVRKFEDTGCLNREVPSVVNRNSDKVQKIELYFQIHPTASVRDASKCLHISASQVYNILTNKLGYKAYSTQTRHMLTDKAKVKRLYFANNFDISLLDRIWFSDESHFYLNPSANKNLVYWAKSKPDRNFIQKPLHSLKLTIWMAASQSGIFWRTISGNVNTDSYLNLIKNEFVPYLRSRNLINNSFFMQDGAPAHTATPVLKYLNEIFRDRVISTKYPQKYNVGFEWPPYSPDLNPLDFSIWGVLKLKVNRHKPKTIIELESAIQHEVSKLDQQFIKNIFSNMVKRIESLKLAHGGHIE